MVSHPVGSDREDMWSGYFERTYGAERCIAKRGARTQARRNWSCYNTVAVTFLNDDGTIRRIETIPAGRFNAGQKATGRRLFHQDGRWAVR
jgi:hypothetical protein